MQITRGDFIELEFTGRVGGAVFDSNREEDLKTLDPKAQPQKLGIIVGQRMVVPGLDKDFEGKEIGKKYSIHLVAKDAFGPRISSLVKTLPLSAFANQKVYPEPGMSFLLDNSLALVRAVSGARVIVDFNNPLAGKDVEYDFTIIKKIDSLDEKTKIFFSWFLRGIPEFESGESVIIKGPKILEQIINSFKPKFKELVGVELEFKVVEKPAHEVKSSQQPESKEATQQSL